MEEDDICLPLDFAIYIRRINKVQHIF